MCSTVTGTWWEHPEWLPGMYVHIRCQFCRYEIKFFILSFFLRQALLETALTRVVLPMPILVLPPMIMAALEK